VDVLEFVGPREPRRRVVSGEDIVGGGGRLARVGGSGLRAARNVELH